MKKVVILGATGMIGSAIYGVLKNKHSLVVGMRNSRDSKLINDVYGGVTNHKVVEFDANLIYQEYVKRNGGGEYCQSFINQIKDADYVINAAGIVPSFVLDNESLTFFLNSAFPHLLAREFGEKLIHITTDCVFDGAVGSYNENSPKNPVDLYGLSKSLGEPSGCLVLRTSTIGRELKNFKGLIEWLLQQEDKEISGFANQFWNGITSKELGRVCDKIISSPDKFPKTGLYHIFSTKLSKYEMLLKFKDKYNINCVVNSIGEPRIDRSLSTIHNFNKTLSIPPFDEMLADL